ncbi:MAG: dephospho-CoA kinase [Deltaproteobacteria bacterium]|nr:dephospho-CoA kinase [Deltaproteobacteria bacterium]
MLLVGLTGGIASGKNSIARILEEFGARIIDADIICRELVEKGKPAWQEIVHFFGNDILLEDGTLDRKKLGRIVFEDAGKREVLNSIIHPKVIDEELRLARLMEKEDPHALVVVNAALLIESGNHKNADKIIVVGANENQIIDRIIKRDGITRKEAKLRMASQLPFREKIKHAHYVIENNGTFEALRKNVEQVYKDLARLL